ncbi:MAG: phosphodiester glycosidase family protein [bacterium]
MLTQVRNMSDPRNVVLRFEMTESAEWKDFVLMDPPRLVIDVAGAESPLVPSELETADPLLSGIRLGRPDGGAIRVVLDLAYAVPYFIKRTLEGHIEVFIRRAVDEEKAGWRVAPGVRYERRVEMRETGPLTYHVVDVDMGRGAYALGVETAEGGYGALEKLTSIVRRSGALIGVNGGYFDMETGAPVDLLVVDGQALTLPERRRAFFGLDRAGTPSFLTPNVEMSVRCAGAELLYARRLNAAPAPGENAVFTSWYGGGRAAGGAGRREYVVRGGAVIGIAPPGGAAPADGFVFSTDGGELFCGGAPVSVGAPMSLVVSSYPDISKIWRGFSAGPMLVENGTPKTGIEEDFSFLSRIVSKRNPRTAVGVTGDNRFVAVVVEGRSVFSAGLFLDELAALMAGLGVRTGMNLDGGGSSGLVVGGRFVNRPSDGKERPVGSAVVVFGR